MTAHFNIRLPIEVREDLRGLANKRHCSITSLVSDLVRKGISETEPPEIKPRNTIAYDTSPMSRENDPLFQALRERFRDVLSNDAMDREAKINRLRGLYALMCKFGSANWFTKAVAYLETSKL